MEPGVPGIGVAKRSQVTPSRDECFLHSVLCTVAITEDERRNRIQPVHRGAREVGECIRITRLCPLHKFALHATAFVAAHLAAFKVMGHVEGKTVQ